MKARTWYESTWWSRGVIEACIADFFSTVEGCCKGGCISHEKGLNVVESRG